MATVCASKSLWQEIEETTIGAADPPNESKPKFDFSVWTRNCEEDMREPISGTTTGRIPPWLNGVLLRNGPGKLTYGESTFQHVFDASALLHRFEIKGGAVTYLCRFLNSEAYRKNMESQRIVFTEFGTRASPDPCNSIFQRFSSRFYSGELSDNANISIYPLADELYAFGECPKIHRIDPSSLETLRSVDIYKKVNIVHYSSHPHVTRDGTAYNIGLAVRKKPAYSIIEFPEAQKSGGDQSAKDFSDAKIVAMVPTRWPLHPSYMHSFGITDSYYVIIEQPLTLSVPTILTADLLKKVPNDFLKWIDNEPSLIHVVSRTSGKLVRTFSTEPFCYFHVINQYEEDDHVVIDICVYKDSKVINCMLTSALKNSPSEKFNLAGITRAVRFVLPLYPEKMTQNGNNLVKLEDSNAKACKVQGSERIKVTPEVLSSANCEMPRIKYPELSGKKYRYFYGIIQASDNKHPGGLVKVDTELKSDKQWYEEGVIACEPIFVPSPDAMDEDDGVVLSSLLYANDKKMALLVLDGKSFEELGRTIFNTPCSAQYAFHGWFVNS